MNQSRESRYFATPQLVDATGNLYLADRVPFRYVQRDDNILHTATVGDTWWGMAEHYYADISDRACGLWWVICDFQTPPVVDPTRTIAPGIQIIIPSASTVLNEVLNVEREVYL